MHFERVFEGQDDCYDDERVVVYFAAENSVIIEGVDAETLNQGDD